MSKKLDAQQINDRLSVHGYSLAGEYLGTKMRCMVRCAKHDFEKEVFVKNLINGCRMACCHEADGLHRNKKLSDSEVIDRLADAGYDLVGKYAGVNVPTLIRCERHGFQKETLLSNIFAGGQMACCGLEANRARGRLLVCDANPFFGRRHSIQTREKLSASREGKPSPTRGIKQTPERVARQIGKPRSDETRKKLSDHMKRRSALFSYCVRKAHEGKTAGKQGIFYMVKIGDHVKFGSATTTMRYRLTRMRQKHPDAALLMYCMVDDAGSYEASMMMAHKQHWSHGEYFHPSVLAS